MSKFNSNIIIGGAQIGNKYGVTNKKKLTKKETSFIINYALKNNIKFIDTASNYQNSEKIIGEIKKSKNLNIITKLSNIKNNSLNSKNWIKKMDQQLKNSKINLKINRLYGLLVHNPNDLIGKNSDKIFNRLMDYKKMQYAKKIGVSVYSIKEAKKILEKFKIDIIQIPINIFNQEFLNINFLENMKRNHIEIHARSIFFQGMAIQDINKIDSYFKNVLNKFKIFDQDCKSNNKNKIKKSLEFVYSNKYINKYVIGFNDLNQFKEVISIKLSKKNLNSFSKYAIDNKTITNPSKWKIRK